MKKITTLLAILAGFTLSAKENQNDAPPLNNFQQSFDLAYAQYPLLKKGVLEAVAYTNTRFHNMPSSGEESCTGIPREVGVMGLVPDGKNYFRNNLPEAAAAAGMTNEEVANDPQKNILAYAALLDKSLRIQQSGNAADPEIQLRTALSISELPSDIQNLSNCFARESFLYSLCSFLDNKSFQLAYHFPDYQLDLPTFFGANYDVLSSTRVTLSAQKIISASGKTFSYSGRSAGTLSADYPPALWVASPNYSAGRSSAISAVTIHDTEGSYSSTISWFQNTSSQVSAHYVVRSSDGQITQMVLESNKGWHVGSENGYTIGIEHEGYAAQTGWYTTALYTESAKLVADICNSGYGINPRSLAFFPWAATTNYNATSTPKTCVSIKGHQHYPNQTHTDPGKNWDWERYYRLVNSAVPAATVYTTASGNFYDSGGSGGNTTNLERSIWTITPTGNAKVTLNFSSFNLESNYDYLFLYDGNSINAPLIGKYTGTTSPGTISSSGGSITAEFRSDCSNTSVGWAATWSTNGTIPGPDNVAPTTTISIPGTWQTANFASNFTESDNVGGSGLFKSFFQVVDLNASGDWRANNSQGFFCDNFNQPTISPEWTTVSGTWGINSSNVTLEQSDSSTTTGNNTNISAPLDQSLSNQYLYHWSGMIRGNGTNRRAGIHIFCDSAATGKNNQRGHSYFVWFRVDQSLLEIYKTGNGIATRVDTVHMVTAAGQWYDWKILYDRSTGLLEVFQNNVLAGSWKDPSPLTTGSGISFRSGNCDWQVRNFRVYRTRTANAPQTITVGTCPTCEIRFQNPNPGTPSGQVKSIVRDSASNFSTLVSQDVNVDWTPPANVTLLNDGPAADMDTTFIGNQLINNWQASSDPNSGVNQYEYAVGTTAGGTNIVNWKPNLQDLGDTARNLTLVSGTTYYTSVRATNGAGLLSGIVTSDGILYLTKTTGIQNHAGVSSLLQVFPNPFSGTTTVNYTISDGQHVKMMLVDMLGRQLEIALPDRSTGTHQLQIDAAALSLAKGMYFLELIDGSGIQTVRVSVQ
jgi:N-acetyl-anhydromuramyl-L-alanine amidase AmpD